MKFLPLIWAGLWRKKLRTILTFLSIAAAFLLFGVLHGVTAGFDDLSSGMSNTRLRILNKSGLRSSLPLSYVAQVRQVPGVKAVSYYAYFGGYVRELKNQIGAGAIEVDSFVKVFPELVLPEAQRIAMSRTRTGAVVGEDLAKQYGWKIGDRVPITSMIWAQKNGSFSWTFDIVGIYHFKDSAFPANEMWFNYDYFDEARNGAAGSIMMMMATVDDINHATAISHNIDQRFENSVEETLTQNEKEWIKSRINQVGDIKFFVNAIIGAVFFTLLFLTGSTMMQGVRERIPELAVLKTYGFSDPLLVTLVVAEAVVVCVAGALTGLGLATTVFTMVYRTLGLGGAPLPTSVFVTGLAVALLVAFVSALPPAWRAKRLDVVAALGGR
jgi:putative ABC transport system permease protein